MDLTASPLLMLLSSGIDASMGSTSINDPCISAGMYHSQQETHEIAYFTLEDSATVDAKLLLHHSRLLSLCSLALLTPLLTVPSLTAKATTLSTSVPQRIGLAPLLLLLAASVVATHMRQAREKGIFAMSPSEMEFFVANYSVFFGIICMQKIPAKYSTRRT